MRSCAGTTTTRRVSTPPLVETTVSDTEPGEPDEPAGIHRMKSSLSSTEMVTSVRVGSH